MNGLILAGGRSSRMGQDKGLMALQGRPLVQWLAERLRLQVRRLAVNSNGPVEPYAALGFAVIADQLGGRPGPLAGVHAGLSVWPQEDLLVVAVDCPLVPEDLAARLSQALAGPAWCAYATCGGQHVPAMLWRAGLADAIAERMAAGERSLKAVFAAHGVAVEFVPTPEADLSINLNTPEELVAAERRLARD